jgi:hypothetical protein
MMNPLAIAALLLAAASPRAIVFGPESVGPVNVTTPVDEAALRGLFPGLKVKDTVDKQADDADWATLSVFRGKDELLQVSPCDAGPLATICIIYSRSPSARTADGVRVGEAYEKAAKKITDCGAGFEREAGKVLCKSVAASNVLVLFGKKGVTAEGMPPAAELHKYRVVELRWVPPRLR